MLTRASLLCLSALLPSAQAFLTALPRPQVVSGYGVTAGSPAAARLPEQGRMAQCLSMLQAATAVIADSELTEVDKLSPPATFFECILQAYNAASEAIKDGHNLLEVEFPPLSASDMANQASSANEITAANTELAIDLAEYFVREGKNVAIMVPDYEELENIEDGLGTLTPSENITIRSVRLRAGESAETMADLVFGIFSRTSKGKVLPILSADMYICIISSGQELPDLEALHNADPDKPMILFNLNLETHRGDLGLPAFPSKDLHYRFLSKIKPAYFLRTRQYAQTLTRPPFILQYQGALFRAYPGGFQCLLDTGRGKYRRVETTRVRPALSEFKEIITTAMQVDDSKMLESLRKGAFSKTWWEGDEAQTKSESQNWRT